VDCLRESGEVREMLELRGFCELPKPRASYKLYESRDVLSSTE
jgi:hypothetical protein